MRVDGACVPSLTPPIELVIERKGRAGHSCHCLVVLNTRPLGPAVALPAATPASTIIQLPREALAAHQLSVERPSDLHPSALVQLPRLQLPMEAREALAAYQLSVERNPTIRSFLELAGDFGPPGAPAWWGVHG